MNLDNYFMKQNQFEPKSILSINILGTEYKISCKTELQEPLLQAAEYLNNKMQEIRHQYNIIGIDKIAILAGLHITHDFLSTKSKNKYDHKHLQDKIQKLNQKIVDAINSDAIL